MTSKTKLNRMKHSITVVLMTTVFLSLATWANAQNKMGYISSQELLALMPETRKADSSLQQLRAALIQNAQDKEAKLNSDIEKFNKDSANYSDVVKDVKRKELQKAYQELTGEEQRIQEQLQQKQQELLQPIQKKANEAIQATAKENGFGYVLERDVLIVAPPGDDILPLVAKKLGIKVPAANPPAAAPAKPSN
jgi:outer membrane protein